MIYLIPNNSSSYYCSSISLKRIYTHCLEASLNSQQWSKPFQKALKKSMQGWYIHYKIFFYIRLRLRLRLRSILTKRGPMKEVFHNIAFIFINFVLTWNNIIVQIVKHSHVMKEAFLFFYQNVKKTLWLFMVISVFALISVVFSPFIWSESWNYLLNFFILVIVWRSVVTLYYILGVLC